MFRHWKTAADLYVRNLKTVLIAVVCEVGLELFEAWRGEPFGVATIISGLLLVGLVVFAFHVDELSGRRLDPNHLFQRNKTFSKFVWRYVGMALALVPLILLGVILARSIGMHQGIEVGLSLLLAVVLYGAVLALLGTMLPAAAVNEDASLKAAMRRGRQTFWMVVRSYLSGPVLSGLIGLAAIYATISAGVSTDVMSKDGTFSIDGAAFSFIAKALFYYPWAIGVAVLCDAYRRAEGGSADPNAVNPDTFS